MMTVVSSPLLHLFMYSTCNKYLVCNYHVPNIVFGARLQQLKTSKQDFPGGLLLGNVTANAGDTGSIPGPERFHMQRGH